MALLHGCPSRGSTASGPLSPPPPPPAYHPAFDRTDDPNSSSEPWDLLGPDGSITLNDIILLTKQFDASGAGHNCR